MPDLGPDLGPDRDQRQAAADAAAMVAQVADDPAGRLDLADRFYADHASRTVSNDLEEYARSELAFMHWEIERGVLNALDHARPGSEWWRTVNASLLRDAAEADLLAQAGAVDGGSTRAVNLWLEFLHDPAPDRWYRAHNGSIATGYLRARRLASRETLGEQALMNIVLYRVLFADALLANPDLALGHLSFLGRLVGDPRNDVVDWIVRVPDFYPRRYPLHPSHEHGVFEAVVAAIDDAIVARRIGDLYEFEAERLGLPVLASLVQNGRLCYPSFDTGGDCARGGFISRIISALLSPALDDAEAVPAGDDQVTAGR